MSDLHKKRILLTGATGYVGGRLLSALEVRNRPVRCLARSPDLLVPHVARTTEVVRGDLLEPETLVPAMRGVTTAYYLVHSMGSDSSFRERDRRAAAAFAVAARNAGVSQIVYLGGLGRGEELSAHLASRHEVGAILRGTGVPVIELRASIIIGAGSLSFEMIRALVDKLPVMVTPRWVNLEAQPIAIEDVIEYLLQAADRDEPETRIYEIGGRDRVSYLDLMREYARQRGLRRLVIPVPVLTPRLSSLWLGLVTPLHARVGRHLIDSIRHETVADDQEALASFRIRPMGIRDAVARALAGEGEEGAGSRRPQAPLPRRADGLENSSSSGSGQRG